MKYNISGDFVGLQKIKDKQSEWLALFEKCALENNWYGIHHNHYDWWMFPIDDVSSKGYGYTVYEGDIEKLKKDDEYIKKYLRGVELLALSWGWDIAKSERISNPKPGQAWQNWPIRLFKASKSVKLFGFDDYFKSLRIFAQDLMKKGADMSYDERDISFLFK